MQRHRGQVLVLVIIVMVALLLMVIFVFDLQNFIRVRHKTQTGDDAAVLAGAVWQGRSLNIIGELNILQATELLLTNVPPFVAPEDSQAADLTASAAVIDQMQTRVCFVGPMLGYTVAQQVAKQNGLRPVSQYTGHISRHISENFGPNGRYLALANIPTVVNGYYWYTPYENMLDQLRDEGIAAESHNSRYMAAVPRLEGQWAWLLLDPNFYLAVNSFHYCWFFRLGLAPGNQIDFSDLNFYMEGREFFIGSEFLPLYVTFTRTGELADDPIDAAQDFVRRSPEHTGDYRWLGSGQDGLPDIQWAAYEMFEAVHSGDYGSGWAETDMYEAFAEYDYMRSDFRPEYVYSGPGARFESSSQPALISGDWDWELGDDTGGAGNGGSLGAELRWSNTSFNNQGASFSQYGARLQSAESRLNTIRRQASVQSIAGAKPLGALDEDADEPPQAAPVVLPVFTEVRLLPTPLIKENPLDEQRQFYQFIEDYFGHPDYPNVPESVRARYYSYVVALERFNDPDSQFNQGWLNAIASWDRTLYGDDGIQGTADDPDPIPRHPCYPPPRPHSHRPGRGGGRAPQGSRGGPPILH